MPGQSHPPDAGSTAQRRSSWVVFQGDRSCAIATLCSIKDVFEYRRGFARVLDLPYNRQELVINLAPAGTLYKRLLLSTEGYAGEVPVIHAPQAGMMRNGLDSAVEHYIRRRLLICPVQSSERRELAGWRPTAFLAPVSLAGLGAHAERRSAHTVRQGQRLPPIPPLLST